MLKRYLTDQIRADLKKKMVLLAGARQVGKTTLALQILSGEKGYLNWDIAEDRERILKRELPPASMLVFEKSTNTAHGETTSRAFMTSCPAPAGFW